MRQYTVVVPLYNQNILGVPIYNEFKDSTDYNIRFIICDNSINDEYKSQNSKVKSENLTYIDMNGNKGISAAYNQAISKVEDGVICIFDQDTEVPDTYFRELDIATEKYGLGVYIPIIKTKGSNKMISPLNFWGRAIITCNNPCEVDLTRCSAFNSGMAVSREIFDTIKYDERLFIGWVDHAFCKDAHKCGISFHLLGNVVLNQDWSRENSSLEDALSRDKIERNDLRTYYSDGIVDRLYGRMYEIYRVLRLSLQYKTMQFIKQ